MLPANVPEPLVPRSGRSLRVTSSPLDVDEDDLVFAGDVQHSDPILDGVTSEAHALRRSGKKGRLSDRGRQGEGSSLTITLPAPLGGLINSTEQLFCYCNRPSSGEVGSWHLVGVTGFSHLYHIRWLLATTKSARPNG